MADGQVPYRDFAVEYPPAALPVFRLPVEGGDYGATFEGLMAAAGVGVVLLVAALTSAWWAPLFVAVSPLLLGSVVLSRFDLWPAFLTVAALAVFLSGRVRLGLGTLGLATAAKVYPALLAPLLVAHVWRTRGRREALVCGAVVPRRDRGDRPSVRAPVTGRSLGRVLGAGRPAAPDRESRLGDPARRASALRPRPDDGVEPRVAESRRRHGGNARGLLDTAPGRRGDRRSGSGTPEARPTATGSSAPAPPPSARSSSSARCSRRSSCSG